MKIMHKMTNNLLYVVKEGWCIHHKSSDKMLQNSSFTRSQWDTYISCLLANGHHTRSGTSSWCRTKEEKDKSWQLLMLLRMWAAFPTATVRNFKSAEEVFHERTMKNRNEIIQYRQWKILKKRSVYLKWTDYNMLLLKID